MEKIIFPTIKMERNFGLRVGCALIFFPFLLFYFLCKTSYQNFQRKNCCPIILPCCDHQICLFFQVFSLHRVQKTTLKRFFRSFAVISSFSGIWLENSVQPALFDKIQFLCSKKTSLKQQVPI